MPRKYNPKSKENLHMWTADNQPTPEQRAAAYKKRSENIAERKTLRAALDAMLSDYYTDGKTGKKLQGTDAISLALFKKAMSGDVRAFETIRDTVGEKPVERVQMATIDPDAEKALDAAIERRRKPHDEG